MSIKYVQINKESVQAKCKSSISVLDSSSQIKSLQRKANMANGTAQRVETPRPNNTGMPDNLKAGIESLSGFSMDDVRVHYNSSKPATVQALAYTQGTDIHVAPGQEKSLPHEAWHVAQQMAGRVSPTTNINGMPVNDNAGLEHEADVMGEKAVQREAYEKKGLQSPLNCVNVSSNAVQCDGHITTVGSKVVLSAKEKCSAPPLLQKLPHIAFESLGGGNRVAELGDLYNREISKYKGNASVYMGVNACRFKYSKKGNSVAVFGEDEEAKSKAFSYAQNLKSKIEKNRQLNHSITIIPFVFDLVGLGSPLNLSKKGTDEEERAAEASKKQTSKTNGGRKQKDLAEKISVKEPETEAKANIKEVIYPDTAMYNFPFYEARAMIMNEAKASKAEFYRWIDSDVRDDSSIDVINDKGVGIFGQDEFPNADGPKVWSGFYKWRANDGDARLPFFVENLNEYEEKCRIEYWKLKNGRKGDESIPATFIPKNGYLPEPLVYMDDKAHNQAINNLNDAVEGDMAQARESDVAFGEMIHKFIKSFSVSKPVKHYFDRNPLRGFVPGKFDFGDAMKNSHQSAFGWNFEAVRGNQKRDDLLMRAYLSYQDKVTSDKTRETEWFSDLMIRTAPTTIADEMISAVDLPTTIADEMTSAVDLPTKIAGEMYKTGAKPIEIYNVLRSQKITLADIFKVMTRVNITPELIAEAFADALTIKGSVTSAEIAKIVKTLTKASVPLVVIANVIAFKMNKTGATPIEIYNVLRSQKITLADIFKVMTHVNITPKLIAEAFAGAFIIKGSMTSGIAEKIVNTLIKESIPPVVIADVIVVKMLNAKSPPKAIFDVMHSFAAPELIAEVFTDRRFSASVPPTEIVNNVLEEGLPPEVIVFKMLKAGISLAVIADNMLKAGISFAAIADAMIKVRISLAEIAAVLTNRMAEVKIPPAVIFEAMTKAKIMFDVNIIRVMYDREMPFSRLLEKKSVPDQIQTMITLNIPLSDFIKKRVNESEKNIRNICAFVGNLLVSDVSLAIVVSGLLTSELSLDEIGWVLHSVEDALLKKVGGNVNEVAIALRAAGCSTEDVSKVFTSARFDTSKISAVVYTPDEIKKALSSDPKQINPKVFAATLRVAGYSLNEVANSLFSAQYSLDKIADALFGAGYTPKEIAIVLLHGVRCSPDQIAIALRDVGCSPNQIATALRDVRCNQNDIKLALFNAGCYKSVIEHIFKSVKKK